MIKRMENRVVPPDDFKPRSLGVAFGMGTGIPVMWGLMLVLLFAFLTGMDVGSVTVSYLNDAMGVLSLIIMLMVVYWLMYWYLYSVSVPTATHIARGKSLTYLHAISSIFNGSWLPAFIPRCGIAKILVYPVERIATALLGLHRSLGLPRRLALGWIPGTHPQVVYH